VERLGSTVKIRQEEIEIWKKKYNDSLQKYPEYELKIVLLTAELNRL